MASFLSTNLQRVQAQINEWFAGDRRPVPWQKLQLFFSALAADMNRWHDANDVVLAANLVLGEDAEVFQFIDPGGAARNVDLPLVAAGARSAFYIANHANAASEDITVRDAAGATLDVLASSISGAANASEWFVWDGTAWRLGGVVLVNIS